jgi:hypothetical protein
MDEGGNVLEGKRRLLAAKKGGEFGGRLVVQDEESDGVRKGGKELEDRLERTHISRRMARLHGYIPNVPMMRDYEYILVALVGRDGKATGEVGRRPLVPVNRERFCRTCGDGRSKASRSARDTRGRQRCGGDWGRRRAQGDRSGRELGTRGGNATPEGVEMTIGGREREGRKLADESSG